MSLRYCIVAFLLVCLLQVTGISGYTVCFLGSGIAGSCQACASIPGCGCVDVVGSTCSSEVYCKCGDDYLGYYGLQPESSCSTCAPNCDPTTAQSVCENTGYTYYSDGLCYSIATNDAVGLYTAPICGGGKDMALNQSTSVKRNLKDRVLPKN